MVSQAQRWPPALDGHCEAHCRCYRTNPKIPPRLPPNQSSKLLYFPPEILQHIALYLPYPSDAVALSHTHPVLRNLFSEHNQLFWYKITRRHTPEVYNKYDSKENYYKKILDAISKNDSRCQICCVKKAHKIWPAFKRRICLECFDDMTIDQVKIRFLKIREESYRIQKRYKGQSVHWACWKPDVERAVEKKHPDKNLEALLKEYWDERSQKKSANQEYRTKTRQAIELRAIEIYKTEFQYLHPLVPLEKFEDHAKGIRLPEVERLSALVRPKKPVWIDEFARSHVLPVWKDIVTYPSGMPLPAKQQVKRRIPTVIKNPVLTHHQERFRSRGAGYNWANKSEPQMTLLIGTCAICATTDLKEYVRREQQKLFPLRPAEEPDRTLIKERQWMTPEELMDHYELHHTLEFYSTTENISYNACEAGKGGFWFWDGIPTGVEGLEQFIHVEKNSYAHRRGLRASSAEASHTPSDLSIGATAGSTRAGSISLNAAFEDSLLLEGSETIEAPFEFVNDELGAPHDANFDMSNAGCLLNFSDSAYSSEGPTSSLNLCPYNSSPFASSSSSAAPKQPIKFPHALIACSQDAFKPFVKDKTLEWYRKLYGITYWPGKDSIFWTSNPTNQTSLNLEDYDGESEVERRRERLDKSHQYGCFDDDSDFEIIDDDLEEDDSNDDGYTKQRAIISLYRLYRLHKQLIIGG